MGLYNIDEIIKNRYQSILMTHLYFTKKGNLLADNPETMEKLFANCNPLLPFIPKRRNSRSKRTGF
jgi:hypothetical protein